MSVDPQKAAPAEASSVAALLALSRTLAVDRFDALAILALVTGRSRSWLIAHDEGMLDAGQAGRCDALMRRRADGEPLAYLSGQKEFHGLLLQVDPCVLIPRPDTETLVDWAIELLEQTKARETQPRVIDLGTGSGAIALAVKHACGRAEVIGTDLSEASLTVARRNAAAHGMDVSFHQGSWWSAIKDPTPFDLVVSNPPYIAIGDPHLAALRHEPNGALTAGTDGLDAIRQITGSTAAHLNPNGWLLMEHGFDQAEAARDLLLQHGFVDVTTHRDLAGKERCSGGRRVVA